MKLRNIDVTLRDGGYRNRFGFDLAYAGAHVGKMEAGGIDWIEIGYKNGPFQSMANMGPAGLCPDDYVLSLQKVLRSPCLGVMAHPKNIDPEEIECMRTLGVAMLRLCMDRGQIDKTLEYIGIAKSLGFFVTLNLTRVSHLTLSETLEEARLGQEAGADVIYLADSNGNLTPKEVDRLFSTIREQLSIALGFHAHDNLGLAMSNSIAAVRAGAEFIDSSLRGMGKGAGNLKMELWLSYLERETGQHYDHSCLLEQAEHLERRYREAKPAQPLEDLVLGFFDLTIEQRTAITSDSSSIVEVFQNAQVHAQTRSGSRLHFLS